MDPLSITAGCMGLISSIFTVTKYIQLFASEVRSARKDMECVHRELSSMSLCLEFLQADCCSRCVDYPEALQRNLSIILNNSDIITQQIRDLLQKLQSNRLGRRIQWSFSSRDEMTKLQSALERQRSCIEIVLSVGSIQILSQMNSKINRDENRSISADMAALRLDTSVIRGNVEVLPQIADEIKVLQNNISHIFRLGGASTQMQEFVEESFKQVEALTGRFANELATIQVQHAEASSTSNMQNQNGDMLVHNDQHVESHYINHAARSADKQISSSSPYEDQPLLRQYDQKMKGIGEQLQHLQKDIEAKTQSEDDQILMTITEQASIWESRYRALANLYNQLRQEHLDLLKSQKPLKLKAASAQELFDQNEKLKHEMKIISLELGALTKIVAEQGRTEHENEHSRGNQEDDSTISSHHYQQGIPMPNPMTEGPATPSTITTSVQQSLAESPSAISDLSVFQANAGRNPTSFTVSQRKQANIRLLMVVRRRTRDNHNCHCNSHPCIYIQEMRHALNQGADVNVIAEGSHLTPLLIELCQQTPRLGVLKFLLEEGAYVNNSFKVLFSTNNSVAWGSQIPDIFRLLLEFGANPKTEGLFSNIISSCNDEIAAEIIDLLLKHGLDIDDGQPLKAAVSKWSDENSSAQVVKVLLQHGADPNAGFPLDGAINKQQVQAVATLLDAGAENGNSSWCLRSYVFEAVDRIKWREGVEQDAVKILKMLLENGANPNSQKAGLTPLQLARRQFSYKKVMPVAVEVEKILVIHGAK